MATWSTTELRRLGRLRPRKRLVIPVEQVHPLIRMAHRRVYERGFELPLRLVRTYGFFLSLRGQVHVRYASHTDTLEPGQLYLVEPFEPHILGSRPGEPHEHLSVHFDWKPDFPTPAKQTSARTPYEVRLAEGLTLARCTDLGTIHPIQRWIEELIAVYHSEHPTAGLEASVLMQRIVLALWRHHRPGVSVHALARVKVQRALEYIHAHYDQPLSVADLACEADLSVTHLTRLMVELAGTTPAQYLRRERIARAKAMLADAGLSIKEIARRCGFGSAEQFSRTFRQEAGLSPTQYRASALPG